MTRYYFDIFHTRLEHPCVDDIGSDLANENAAQAEAVQVAAEWLKDHASVGSSITVEVRDGAPIPLFAVTATIQMQPVAKEGPK